jgi:hypothetical protein
MMASFLLMLLQHRFGYFMPSHFFSEAEKIFSAWHKKRVVWQYSLIKTKMWKEIKHGLEILEEKRRNEYLNG